MIFKRELLYLSLPGVALVLGFFWIRRRKKIDFDSGGTEPKTNGISKATISQSDNTQHSNSMPIKHEKCDTTEGKLGKSAPIDIVPNRSSPIQVSDHRQNGADGVQTVMESDSEEDFDTISPIDLPCSAESRRFSYTLKKSQTIEPVVVKATNTPKISPEQIFIETKYTEHISTIDIDINKCQAPNTNNNETATIIYDNNNAIPPGGTESLSSPSLSICSVQSADSGKGSSPPRSVGAPAIIYEFLIGTSSIGQLLGKKGAFANIIKSETGASVIIRKHPESKRIHICALEGTQQEVDAALKLIRKKLPKARHPNLTLQRVYFATNSSSQIYNVAAMDPSVLQLHLIEGINNDVTVSAIISGGHIFVHQPLHPSYLALNKLEKYMTQSYSQCESPLLPELAVDAVCVGCVQNCWYRLQMLSHSSDTDSCILKYLDYGGYTSLLPSELRQIRTDFMTVPFQSIECLLSNIQPVDSEWSPDAANALQMLTQGFILQAQVTGYSNEGIPEVFLYACLSPNNVVFINKELVARGLAKWVDDEELYT